jgi:nucleotide-binding universal stress UspA family protein
MYNSILVPVAFDHAGFGEHAIAVARKLLNGDGQLTLLHVMDDVPGYITSYLPEGILEKNRKDAVAKLDDLAKKAGLPCSIAVVRGHANRSIVAHAAEKAVDCIVIASHKPGLEDYFLGSTAAHVVRHAKCSVHVIR